MPLSKILPASQDQYVGARNLIINGNAACSQRGTSFSSAANNTYVVDRFRVKRNGMDNLVYDLSQSSTSPDGFGNSIKLDVTTAETSSADGEYLKIDTTIEAQNVQQLKYGTSSAEQMTMSFWVRSSTTGTYAIEIYTEDPNKQITNTYTVDSANTFEYKTVTFVGDTGGSINNDNGQGFLISWFLSVPSNYKTGDSTSWRTFAIDGRGFNQTADVASTTGEFYITGVQLEVGSATPFEHESFAETLRKCQRYFYRIGGNETDALGTNVGRMASGVMTSSGTGVVMRPNPVTMRDAPNVTFDDTLSKYTVMTNRTTNAVTAIGDNQSTASTTAVGFDSGASSTDGAGAVLRSTRAQSTVSIDAEL